MIKGSFQEEDIIIVNIYAPNIGAPQCIRQTLIDIKGEIDSSTITVRNFNTPLTPMDRSSKQKINKQTQVLFDTLDEMYLTDIFRTSHPNSKEHNFYSSVHGTFSRIDCILGQKSNPYKFKKIEIVSNVFGHNAIRLDINYNKTKHCKKHKTWRLNNTFLNSQQVTEEIKSKIKKILEINDNENTTQSLWDAAKAGLRGKFIAIQAYLKEEHQIDNLTLHLEQLEKD